MRKKITIDAVVARWTDPGARPLFKGSLIDENGCRCAQGDVLHMAGWGDTRLRGVEQSTADKAVADLLHITRFESVLLRQVNDSIDGSPQSVLNNLPSVIGPSAPRIVAFMRHAEKMSPSRWAAVWAAAGDAVWDAAGDAAGDAAWAAAGDAAWAVYEIMGAEIMRARNQPFYFLPLFGFACPEDITL